MRKRFKNYRIVEELLSSQWTIVYKAIQEPLDRKVSLKVLNPRLAEEELVKRFEREAKICANLLHPNIVRVFDFGRWRGEYFIVQEWVEGISLKELLKRGPLPPSIGVYIIREAATGLAYAHTQGVIHRDIKPGNILIGRDGSVKLTDFGLARSLKLPAITLDGTFLGTPAYCAPEQVKGGEIDARADIFSLGVVGYEILTGVNPFAADTYSAVIERICHKRPRPADRVNPSIPSGLAKIIQRSIAKNLTTRYQDLGQLLKELGRLARSQEIEVSGSALASYLRRPLSTRPPAVPKKKKGSIPR